MPRFFAVPLLLLVLLLPLAASTSAAELRPGQEQLGSTEFPTSGSEEAQPHFMKGLLNLHSFEYDAARLAFQAARLTDPSYAMAYWGEAMTHNHPIWMEENVEAAREVLQKLAPTAEERAAKAPTAREKAYLGALEILVGEGDKTARDNAYAAAMREIMETYPDDLDAAAFYALSLLGTCHEGRDHRVYMQALAVAQQVFAKNPHHPGAAHYLIHCVDDAVHAPLGLAAARVYAAIAPDAVHALPMPSHIFLALGRWDDVVGSNEQSFAAGERRLERLDLEPDRRDYHGLYWLHYALLQQGRFADAQRQLDIIAEDTLAHPTVRTRTHHAMMRAAHLVETENWDMVLFDEGPDLSDLSPTAATADLFAGGMAAVKRGEIDAASQTLVEIRRRLDSAADGEGGAHSMGYTRVGGVRTGPAEVMALELEGLILYARGRYPEAFAKLDDAVRTEEDLPFGFGPAMPVKPSFELYGELLLERGRAEEAMTMLQTALERNPRRARALVALLAAAEQAGDVRVAEDAARTLAEVRRHADAEVRGRASAP